jgi:hypothetical protein
MPLRKSRGIMSNMAQNAMVLRRAGHLFPVKTTKTMVCPKLDSTHRLKPNAI